MSDASNDPALQRIYALIGQIATTWSEVELYWYLIFTVLMSETSRAKVDAIFFQWDTSARQRELILSVADATYLPDKAGRPHPKRRRIGQLCAASDCCAGRRNAAIHAVLNRPQTLAALLQGQYSVQPGANPRKRNKLAGTKIEIELVKTAGAIDRLISNLRDFLDANVPKLEVSPELPEALRKLGFQVPTWITERREDQADPKAEP